MAEVRRGFQFAPAQCAVCSTSDQSLDVLDLGPVKVGAMTAQVYVCSTCVMAAAMKMAPELGKRVVFEAEWEAMSELVEVSTQAVSRAERAEGLLKQLAELASEAVDA